MAFDLVARLRLTDLMSPGLRRVSTEMDRLTQRTERVSAATTRAARVTREANSRTREEFGRLIRASESGGNSFNRSMQGMSRGAGSLTRAIGGIAVAMAAVVAARQAWESVIIKPLKLASEMEQATIAFTTMLGSASKAQKFLTELTEYANKTPFELPQLRDASRRLLAYGFELKSILPMMTGIGNAASGLGLGAEGIDRITLALGQMKAKAKVSGDEMLQLTEAGIPAWQILADKMKLSTAQVMKLSEKGLIPADKAINVLIDGMNKRFPNMMEKQSKSLAGLYSTIKDTFNSKILTKWGEGLAAGIKPRLDRLVTWIDRNETTISRWGRTLQTVGGEAADWVAGKFEGALTYVNRLLKNPQFNKLSASGKIKFVIEDITKTFDVWYQNGGKQKIVGIAESTIDTLAVAMKASAQLLEAASKIGTSIADGLMTGFKNKINESPYLAALIGGGTGAAVGRMFGPIGMATGAAVGTTTGVGDHYGSKTGVALGKKLNNTWVGDFVRDVFGTNKAKPNSHAGGLSNVPFNGYPALLHKGERVKTKAEADAERSGRNSRGQTTNYFTIYGGTDAKAIALQVIDLINQAEGAHAP